MALVYVNWGRLVAECDFPGCGDARVVDIGQPTMQCCVGDGRQGNQCPGHVSDLDWPADLPQVVTALNERTSDKRRNWFPQGHPVAVATGQPHGQSVAELQAEAEAGEAADAAFLAERRAELLGQMRDLGVTSDEALAALKGT